MDDHLLNHRAASRVREPSRSPPPRCTELLQAQSGLVPTSTRILPAPWPSTGILREVPN
jgi:hypothetical protein